MFRETVENNAAGLVTDPGAAFDNAQGGGGGGLLWDNDEATVNLQSAMQLEYETESDSEDPDDDLLRKPSMANVNTAGIEDTVQRAVLLMPSLSESESETEQEEEQEQPADALESVVVQQPQEEEEEEEEEDTPPPPPPPAAAAEEEEEEEERLSQLEDAVEELPLPAMPQGLEVHVRRGPQSDITLETDEDGTRGLSFIPIDGLPPGVYEVEVLWRGEPVEGSPFMVATDAA